MIQKDRSGPKSASSPAAIRRAMSRFDAAGCALFLLDSAGRLVHHNRRAQAMIGSSVSVRDGQVQFRDSEANALLRGRLARSDEHGTTTTQSHTLLIRVPGEAGKRVMAICPAGEMASGRIRQAPSLTALMIWNMLEPRSPSLRGLQSTFDLTPAEAIIGRELNRSTLQEAAEICGIAYETARTHLKSILAKTGARRQADLLRIIDRFAEVEEKLSHLEL